MRYVGGKSKIATKISDAILAATTARKAYYEPFVGGGSTLAKLCPHFEKSFASDAHEDIVLMWKEVQKGWIPHAVTYEEYQILRYSSEPSALRGFAGFGGSFGGRWFEGFARGGTNADGTPRNHQAESGRAVSRIAESIAQGCVNFDKNDYREISPERGSVVYCDPPYRGSSKDYKPGKFDSDEFWEVVAAWADAGASVFVSEYSAPDGWASIWSAQKRQSLVHGSGDRDVRTEHLFMRSNAPRNRATDETATLFDLLDDAKGEAL